MAAVAAGGACGWLLRGKPRSPGAARSASGADKRTVKMPLRVWAGAVGALLTRAAELFLLGVPMYFLDKHCRSMDAPWYASFWARLPFVLALGWFGFPWLAKTAVELAVPPGGWPFGSRGVILGGSWAMFLVVVGPLYSVMVGVLASTLWARLQKVRALFYREFDSLALLEARIPEGDDKARSMLGEHVAAIGRFALEGAVGAPSRWNRLTELSVQKSLKDDVTAQNLILAAAGVRAERRSLMSAQFPLVMWAALRVLAVALLLGFVALAAGDGQVKPSYSMRGLFTMLVLIAYWANHVCRDLVDLRGGDFQLDDDEVARESGFAALKVRLGFGKRKAKPVAVKAEDKEPKSSKPEAKKAEESEDSVVATDEEGNSRFKAKADESEEDGV